MALKSKALVLAQLDLAAAALSLAYDDSVNVGTIAAPVRDPRHPLRNINKLFTITDGGLVQTNTAYLDKLYNVAGTELINNAAEPSGSINSKIV